MSTIDALTKRQNKRQDKGIVKTALAQMIEDGWYLDNNTVENMNEYFEIAINHLEEVYNTVYVSLGCEKKGCLLEITNHHITIEKDLLDLIRKFKKVRKMI